MQIISPTRASSQSPLEVRGGLGANAWLGPHRNDGYDSGGYLLELHPALRLTQALAVEAAISSWSLSGQGKTARATLWGAGARFDHWVSPHVSLFADAHLGLGVTGPDRLFMFDGGGGVEYAFNDVFSLGLFGRYAQMVHSRPDPRFLGGGLVLGLFWPEARLPPEPLHSPPPATPPTGSTAAPGSGGPAGSGMPDAAAPLARDGGVPDGMMADRDAAPDGVLQ
jgi:hypothetical protein